jgi:hypothetical protein
MNHHDAEISDVVVVLQDIDEQRVKEVIDQLKTAGLQISSMDQDTGTIEGSVDAAKVGELKKIKGVSYVRSVMTYTADYPPGDPRDLDGKEETYEDSED